MAYLPGFLAALLFGLLSISPDIFAIKQSTISTAAIGYFFLPFQAIPTVTLVFAVYCLGLFSWRQIRKGKHRAGIAYALLSVILLSYGLWNFAQPRWEARKVAQVVETIPSMTVEDLNGLLDHYPSFPNQTGQRIFILNALLERKDLQPELLQRIAELDDKALFEKLYSRYGLLGKNRKGLSVARLIALHPHVSPDTLAFLGKINEPYLQGNVAGNEKTPLLTLESLYEISKNIPDGYLIQWGLAHNKTTPVPILKELASNPNPYTGPLAQQTLAKIQRP